MTDTRKSSNNKSQKDFTGATVIRGLSEDKQQELLARLYLFTKRHYYGPLNHEDLVMQAVADVLAGIRSWNQQFPPFENLCWVIKSIAGNQLRKECRTVPLDSLSPIAVGPSDTTFGLSDSSLRPETYEIKEARNKLIRVFREITRDDETLRQVINLALDLGKWKPSQIAESLNIEKSEVYNSKRRIKRRLVALLSREKKPKRYETEDYATFG